ncbi:unnamed protein product [Parnassius apollo]|uniref:V-type proton ATPase subunit a n=1 Tax=Parnassius apollo TaxID=110799 RepID=A0A8S3VZ81_PARAO|nr:unnamed protein product [Parnassius apollo]
MSSMLRSDAMSMCDVYLQPEAAFDIVSRFGEMGCLQFLDVNEDIKPYLRKFASEVCRCAEMERRLHYMESEMKKDDIEISDLDQDPPALQPNEMSQFENALEKWEDDIVGMSENQTGLLNNYLELREMLYVLIQIGPLLGNAEIAPDSLLSRKGGGETARIGGRLVVISGVVQRNRSFPFETMLWRVSRGNIYYRQASQDATLQDPYTGKDIRKVAFLAICQGEQLSTRMEKVCTGFRVNVYPCPETKAERQEMINKLYHRIGDLEQVLKKTKYHRCKALKTVGKQWSTWMMQVKKTKAIYHTMNLFTLDITKNCLIGKCWVPDMDLIKVNDVMEQCSAKIGTNVPSFMSKTETIATPPTYHRTNKFTSGFQALINAYSESSYGELNPVCLQQDYDRELYENEDFYNYWYNTHDIWTIFKLVQSHEQAARADDDVNVFIMTTVWSNGQSIENFRPGVKFQSMQTEKLKAKISQFRRYQRRDSDKKAEDLLLAEVAKYSIPFGELMIHQAIRSIEFVLSTVSHTASYLRLWALSLAHEQLSDMLWQMIMSKLALKDRTPYGSLKIFIVFSIWAIFAVSILVVMEGLSAFLHTLRLHWVEFMSKFYEGNGYPFQPLTFEDLRVGGDNDKDSETMCKKTKLLNK